MVIDQGRLAPSGTSECRAGCPVECSVRIATKSATISVAFEPRPIPICGLKGESIMPDSYDREVVQQETTSGEPERAVSPLASSSTSRTPAYPEVGITDDRAILLAWWVVCLTADLS